MNHDSWVDVTVVVQKKMKYGVGHEPSDLDYVCERLTPLGFHLSEAMHIVGLIKGRMQYGLLPKARKIDRVLEIHVKQE